MDSLLTIFAAMAAIMYLGGPILIKFNMKSRAHPTFGLLQPNMVTPDTWNYLMTSAQQLVDLGFGETVCFSMPDQMPNMLAYGILMANRAAGDSAMVTVMFGMANGAVNNVTAYVEFSTKFDDGLEFDTLNAETPPAFKVDPNEVKTRLPGLRDTATMYGIHRMVMEKRARGGRKIIHEPGQEIAYLADAMIKSAERQVAFGRYYLDTAADAYRPTWAGAFLMTWPLLWPIKSIVMSRVRREADALIAQYHRGGM
jgi:hypothetical protein